MGKEEGKQNATPDSRKEKRAQERQRAIARANEPAKRQQPPINPESYGAKKKAVPSAGAKADSNATTSPVMSKKTKKTAGQEDKSVKSSKFLNVGKGKKETKPAKGKKVKKKGPLWARILKWFFGIFFSLILLGGVIGGATFLILYNKLEIPSPQKFASAQTTTVYWGSDNQILGKFAERNRTIVDTNSFEHPWVSNAVIASEDRTFYTNRGVDFKGIARAFLNNIRGLPRQGASTITQQYVDNYYLGRTRGYVGKAKEAILALKINRQLSKNTILNDYLNTIYFGRGAYGIQAAAQAYFGVDAKNLTLAQSAMLAGIIPSPNLWDPARNKEKAEQRFNRVLRIMYEDKKISKAELDQTKFPEVLPVAPPQNYWGGTNGYLLQSVRKEMETIGYTADQIDTLGYKIYITIDPAKQADLVQAVQDHTPKDAPPGLQTSAISVDLATGGILAEYGGKDYLHRQRNNVTQDNAQAGSTFKVFTMLAGLRDGYKMTDKYLANSGYTVRGKVVNNNGGLNWGVQNLIQATKVSSNTPFVQLAERVGVQNVIKAAEDAGYPKDTPGLQTDTPLITLGSAAPHAIDIAQAYTTIADGGIRRPLHIIARITDSDGNEVYKPNTKGVRAFEPQEISDLMQGLKEVATPMGSAYKLANFPWPVGAKSGTSSQFKSAQFVAFTNQILTTVNMYNIGEDGAELSLPPMGGVREVYGGTFPAEIWLQYMYKAMQGLPKEPLFSVDKDASVVNTQVEKQSNYVTIPNTPNFEISEQTTNIMPNMSESSGESHSENKKRDPASIKGNEHYNPKLDPSSSSYDPYSDKRSNATSPYYDPKFNYADPKTWPYR